LLFCLLNFVMLVRLAVGVGFLFVFLFHFSLANFLWSEFESRRSAGMWGTVLLSHGMHRRVSLIIIRTLGGEKQFENAAFCCISFWPEYRNVSRRISSIPGGWINCGYLLT
jgi:hypothetical protein